MRVEVRVVSGAAWGADGGASQMRIRTFVLVCDTLFKRPFRGRGRPRPQSCATLSSETQESRIPPLPTDCLLFTSHSLSLCRRGTSSSPKMNGPRWHLTTWQTKKILLRRSLPLTSLGKRLRRSANFRILREKVGGIKQAGQPAEIHQRRQQKAQPCPLATGLVHYRASHLSCRIHRVAHLHSRSTTTGI